MGDALTESIKVLVVDDDPNIVNALRINLERRGFGVTGAFGGQEGIEAARREIPDLIILDVEMPPGISGSEVCSVLRQDPKTAEIPIIFLTAKVDVDAMSWVLEDEAQAYIQKPFMPSALLEKIGEVLGLEV